MDLQLSGRRAAVMAASQGLGFATAAALVEQGVTVAICGRNQQRIEAAAAQLGTPAIPIVADISTIDGAQNFGDAAHDALGGVDILVINSGGPTPGGFSDTPTEAYGAAFAALCSAPIALCKTLVPEMCARGWGRVVAITSIAVRQPIGTLMCSNTARAGLTGFLKTLALEVAGNGVTVNSVQPGLHATARLHALHGDNVAEVERTIPMRTFGAPRDFGAVVAFLCSEQAKFVTGVALPVDGGAYGGLQ